MIDFVSCAMWAVFFIIIGFCLGGYYVSVWLVKPKPQEDYTPKPIGHVINITSYNIDQCEQVLKILQDDSNRFITLMNEYPVIFEFCGWYFCYSEEEKFKKFVSVLSDKIDQYKARICKL
jgi:hypothetical protein